MSRDGHSACFKFDCNRTVRLVCATRDNTEQQTLCLRLPLDNNYCYRNNRWRVPYFYSWACCVRPFESPSSPLRIPCHVLVPPLAFRFGRLTELAHLFHMFRILEVNLNFIASVRIHTSYLATDNKIRVMCFFATKK